MSPHLSRLAVAVALTTAADAAVPPVEAPRPVLLTIADAPWAGPIIVMPAAKPTIDPVKDAAARVDPQAAIERAFRLMESGWGNDALADELGPYFDDAAARNFAASAQGFDRSPETFHPQAAVPVRIDRLGDSIARFDYLQRFPRATLLWTFTFTRHDGRWRFRNVAWTRHLWMRPDLFDAVGTTVVADLDETDAAMRRFADSLGTDAERSLVALLAPAATPDAALRPEYRSFVDLAVRARAKKNWKPLGIELLSVRALTPSIVRYVLAERSEDDVFVWHLIFYKTADGWEAIDARFDSGVRGLSRLLPGLQPPDGTSFDFSPTRSGSGDRPPGDDLLRLGNDPFRRN